MTSQELLEEGELTDNEQTSEQTNEQIKEQTKEIIETTKEITKTKTAVQAINPYSLNNNNLNISHDINSLPPKPPTDLSKLNHSINTFTRSTINSSPSRQPFSRSSPYHHHQSPHSTNPSYQNYRSPTSSQRTPSRHPHPDHFKYSHSHRSPERNPHRSLINHHRSNHTYSRSHSPNGLSVKSASKSRPTTRSPSREPSNKDYPTRSPHSRQYQNPPKQDPSRSRSISSSPSRSYLPSKRPRPLSRSPSPSKPNIRNNHLRDHQSRTSDHQKNTHPYSPTSSHHSSSKAPIEPNSHNRISSGSETHPTLHPQLDQNNLNSDSKPGHFPHLSSQSIPTKSSPKLVNQYEHPSTIPENHSNHSDQLKASKITKPKFQNYQPTFFFHRSPQSNPYSQHSSLESNQPSTSINKTINQQTIKKCFVGISNIESYELIEKLGEGTFGEVFKGIYRGRLYAQKQKLQKYNQNPPDESQESSDHGSDLDDQMLDHRSKVKSGMVVALKRIIVHNELDGLPITALREIRILKSLDHPNIVPVVDIAFSRGNKKLLKRGNTYMVFPYIDHDLAGLMENKSITFNVSQIKLYSKQLLLGTAYLHRNKILHRDLKAANLLISNEGQLMIADFGLARSIEQQHNTNKREYTNCVVTRWYRPPEILLGNRRYGTAVDMWGIGCVIAEMFKGGPILTGSTDVNQCELIFRLCGSPTTQSMPGWEKLPGCEGIRSWSCKPRRVREEYERISPELADLLDHLLVLDPSKRFTAEEALDHDWFWTDPMAIDPAKLPHYEPSHEYDRRKRQEQSKKTQQHQLASFTEIQASSSSISAKPTVGQQPPKSRILPRGTSNSRHPTAFSGENLPFPDKFKNPDALPAGGRLPYDSGPPGHRGSMNHSSNPYSSHGMSGMMVNNDVRGGGENRGQYDYSSRRMLDGNRGGPGGLPPHPYQVPPPIQAGGSFQPMSGSVPSMGSYGHASLPLRPMSSFDRGPYDTMRSNKPTPPISMMGGVVNGVMGGMAPAPPYGHPHPPSSRHPDPYMLMGGPPPPLLHEHAQGDDRTQRGDAYPKPPYSQHSMVGGDGGAMRNGYNGVFRSRGSGRADGRSRTNHDRWTPSDSNSHSGAGGSGPLGYPNDRGVNERHRQGGRGGNEDRRYRNGNTNSHENINRGNYQFAGGGGGNNNRHHQVNLNPQINNNINHTTTNSYSSYNHHLPNHSLQNDLRPHDHHNNTDNSPPLHSHQVNFNPNHPHP